MHQTRENMNFHENTESENDTEVIKSLFTLYTDGRADLAIRLSAATEYDNEDPDWFPYKNFSILFVFYTYFTAIIPILLIFSLIKKIDHLFYCWVASIETLFYKQWSILSLFYYTKQQNSL